MRWHRLTALLLLLPIVCDAQGSVGGILFNTTTIGTPEKPTIEGGLIHQAEKDDLIASKKVDKTRINVDLLPAVSKITDEFSSDKQIKQLLTTAASDHKLAYVLQRANQMHLPATVALIPMVESHYQTNAVSSKGAVGAWQFMPTTASAYGLTNPERTPFTTSTDAALRLLSDLHQQFGNWTLAFAAYNAGSGRVLSALRQHPKAQWIDDLALPLETRRYLHRLSRIEQMMARLPLNSLA